MKSTAHNMIVLSQKLELQMMRAHEHHIITFDYHLTAIHHDFQWNYQDGGLHFMNIDYS